MRPTVHRPSRATLLAGALAVLTACSSAPAPDRLAGPDAGLDATGGGAAAGVQAPDGTGAQVAAPGTQAPGQSAVSGSTGGAGAAPAGVPAAAGPATAQAGSAPVAPTGTTPRTGSSAAAAPGTDPGAPTRSTLFTRAEDTIGLTPTSLTMCAHAALTYGKAFNTEDADFNVFWTALNAEKNGIFGRKVTVTYENDDYKPTTAVTAARACKAKKPFILLGGIGFDQIPAVRNYVEAEHILYLHHTATVNGSRGLRYSFTELPTVERVGEAFAQLYLSKYKGRRIGVIKRDGENWEPGVEAFKAFSGAKFVAEKAVPQNQGNYTNEILAMKNAGAEVVWIWENALGATQIVKQFKAQNYSPNMLLFPFNLTAQTLGNDALAPKLDGVAMFSAYSKGDYTGPFASYADDIKMFEQQYAKYRPNVDLGGNGGDLLFLNWQAQKALYAQLLDCGKDCTRNRFVDVLQGYNKRPTSSACTIDFTRGDGQHGSDKLFFMETYAAPGGKVNWRNSRACVGRS